MIKQLRNIYTQLNKELISNFVAIADYYYLFVLIIFPKLTPSHIWSPDEIHINSTQ